MPSPRPAGRRSRAVTATSAAVPQRSGEGCDLPQLPETVELVLDVVAAVPAGRVTSYGRVGAAIGGVGPRQVAAVLARYGGLTCWWRVVDAGGRLPERLALRAQARWREEGTPMVAGAVPRVRLEAALWVPPGVF